MKKISFLLLCLGLFISGALPLLAQGSPQGCADSPENPTVILAVVGSAGAFFVSARARMKARRRTK